MPQLRAVFFDLDDTLFDCTGKLVAEAQHVAAEQVIVPALARVLREHGPAALEDAADVDPAARLLLPIVRDCGPRCTPETIVRMLRALEDAYGPYCLIFDELARIFGLGEDFADECYQAYQNAPVTDITLFPGVAEVLAWLRSRGYLRFLISTGSRARQEEKLRRLGLGPDHFEMIRIAGLRLPRLEQDFRAPLAEFRLEPEEVLCVGDRLREEIFVARQMGMVTARVNRGHYRSVLPRFAAEQPDYVIDQVAQVPVLLRLREMGYRPGSFRVVAIGGGTGLPIVLQGLKTFTRQLTAIVGVTDTGGHSGELLSVCGRGFLPPGDVRNVLVALAGTEASQDLLAGLFSHRFAFEEGRGLTGASVGNLLIAALFHIRGRSFKRAIQDASELLKISGQVLPATEAEVDIRAELADGTVLPTETALLVPGHPPVRRVWLEARPGSERRVRPDPDALHAIARADLIVLGPGALYTSVITNLLVPEVAAAVRESPAKKVYVCNIVTQPGQTEGYTASDHVRAVLDHLTGERADSVGDFTAIVNAAPEHLSEASRALVQREGKELVAVDCERLDALLDGRWRAVDLLGTIQPWEGTKAALLRHDPCKVADAICREFCRMHGTPI